jgi:hypothetical protein
MGVPNFPAERASELSTNGARLWKALSTHQANAGRLGSYSATRARLALHRLAPSTWNQYASSIKHFITFLAEEQIDMMEVTETSLEMFICWVEEHPTISLSGASLASYLSGIRTCWRELGVDLPLSGMTNTAAALAGYRQLHAPTSPAIRRLVWPAAYTVQGIEYALPLLEAFAAGDLSTTQENQVIAIGHITTASLTMQRGDTTNVALMLDIEIADDGNSWYAVLVKQKRARPQLPQQHHHATARTHDPSRFVIRFVLAQRRRGHAAVSLLFGRTATAKRSVTLDAAVKLVVKLLHLPASATNPYTGHCVRIGAISEAFALGVPLLTCAFFCGHKKTTSTEEYVRHGTVPSSAAQLFFQHLVPRLPDNAVHFDLQLP